MLDTFTQKYILPSNIHIISFTLMLSKISSCS